MKTFNFNQSLTRVMNNNKGLLLLCFALATFGVNEAWGKETRTWNATTAVSSGKGTAKVTVSPGSSIGSTFGESKETTTSSSVTVSVSQSATLSSSFVSRSAKFEATAATGYSFGGWYSSSACTGSASNNSATWEKAKTGKDGWTIAYYAKFTPNTYTITFDKQNGTGGSNSVTATYDADMPTATAPTRTGYDFAGYYDATSGGTQYYTASMASAKTWDKTSATTLYARWTAHKYTIAFNGNGATSGSMSNQPYTYDVDQNLSANNFSRNYTITYDANGGTCGVASASKTASFLGWATTPTGGKEYDDKQLIHNLTSTNNQTINLYAVWGDATTSAILPTATKDNSVIEGWYDGDDFVGEPGESYTPKQNVTLIAHWINKYDIVVTGSDQSMKVDGTQDNAFTFVHAENPTPKITIVSIDPINNGDDQVIEYDAANNKIIAHNAGTATICFEQAGTSTMNEGTSATFTYTVSKIANTLAADATHSMKVDETWNGVISGKNSDATVTKTTSDGTLAYYDVANNKIVAQNTGNQSFTSKEVTITISQEATYKYTAVEKTITVTVNKHDNHISINGSQDIYQASIYMDAQQAINLTATNIDYSVSPIAATQTAGNTIATLNAAQTQVTSNHNLGDATWTVFQPENYKYKAANASFTIHVVTQAEATDCYVLNAPAEKSYGKYGDCENKSYQDFNLTGPGKTLSFNMWKYSVANDIGMKVYGYDANGNQVFLQEYSIGSIKTSAYLYSFDIASNVTRIRIQNGGGTYASASTLNCYASEVRVTRKTYLNASDFTINTQSDNTTLIYPGTTGTGAFQVDYSLANGGDLKLVCDNPKFTISKTSQSNVDCKTGSFNVDMTYTSQEAGTDYAHIVIYNNVYRKEITVTGITQKHQQTLNWKENFDKMSKGSEEKNAASSSHGLVTYTSTNINVIRVDNDANGYATILVAVAKGESEITATAAGDDEYDSKSISKTISVTEDHVQYIIWNQSLMGLKYESGSTKTLTAYATSEEEGNVASSRPITYTSDNTSVVSISGNQLIIQGIGTATITARQAGGTIAGITYEAAEKTNKVIVKDPSAKCESFVYEQGNEAEEFFQMSTSEIKGTEHTLNGEPAKLTFYAKREYWNLAIDYSKGNIVVDAYTSSGWQQVLDCGEPPIGSYAEYSVNLNRDVTKIRFRRPKGGQGYHYIAGAKIERARYIETTTPPVFQANVGEVQEHTISLSYSNITSDLLLTLAGGANSRFSIDKTSIEGECGDAQKNVTLTISYAPTQDTEGNVEGKEQETLNITDGTTIRQVTLYGKASKVDQHIVWDINDNNNIYTIEQVTLTAKTETNLHQAAGELAYHIVGASTEGCGTIDNNILSFSRNGVVYVEAYTIASDKYNTATSVTKSWMVSKTPTKVTTNPTISGDVVSGTDIASLVLNDGAAQNIVNNQTVEGAFAITAGNLVNVGQQTLTITFTPNNTDMYEGCTTTITVNVVQREATAEEVGTPSAAPITYGNAINTSVLSGNGSLVGEWTWVDEEANKAIPNAGTIDNLNVIFTPNDGNVKPVTTTVSLTVNKAQPVISWTGETTYEWGEIANLFSASNDAAVTMTSLNESVAKIQDNKIVPLSAGTVTIRGEIEENDNCLAASLDQTITINAPADNIFTNAAGDNDWNNPINWTSGIVPEKLNDVDVVVNGEMTIDEEIHVNSLTIESGASVKVVVNGDLTVQGQSQERIEYGDLFVKNGGEVILPEDNSHKMMVHNLVIESSIGTSNGTSTSGQISNLDALAFDNGGDAYIDINLDPSGNADDSQWYCFTVPFPVDIATGIARKELDGSFKVLQDHTNFDILRYNPTQRLNTGKGWEYYHGTLQPGEFYLIAIDGTNNVYSFRKKKDAELISANTMSLAVNGDNTNVNANWNAVGNPTLQKVTASFSNKIVQVYVNGGSRYQAVSTDDANFVVGCPFFIQASVAENLTLTADNSKSQFYAPARQDDNTNTLFCVRFGQNNHFSDQIFVTASEQALNQYEIGYDVAKIGVSKQSAQLWVNAYNQQLCAHEAVLTNDLADMALTLFAPKAGEYNLSVARENMPTDETLYLTQNGQIIWNLSESDYTIEAVKGDNNQYGLRLISSHRITTDNEQLESRNRAEKFIMNNQLYILRDGQLYDATGKKIQ